MHESGGEAPAEPSGTRASGCTARREPRPPEKLSSTNLHRRLEAGEHYKRAEDKTINTGGYVDALTEWSHPIQWTKAYNPSLL